MLKKEKINIARGDLRKKKKQGTERKKSTINIMNKEIKS